MTQYLSAEEILVLHSEIIDATGGSHGVRELGLLPSLAEKPKAAFGGADLYPDLFIKAAICLEAVANYRVFIDGNKRTSIIVAARFLYVNGHELNATNPAVEKFVLAVAADKTPLEDIAAWLKRSTKKVPKKR